MKRYIVCFIFLSILKGFGNARVGTIILQGGIGTDITLKNTMNSVYYQQINDYLLEDKTTTLNIIICTPGGNLEEAVLIYDYINSLRRSGIKVNTIASGICMSAGMIILQAGDVRYAGRNTLLMTHKGYLVWPPTTEPTPMKERDLKETERSLQIVHNQMLGIFSYRMRKPLWWLEQFFTDDEYFMDANSAYQNGFIDSIIYDTDFFQHKMEVKK